jgi:hypothetical protein
MKELYKFDFYIRRQETNFDRACDDAQSRALEMLGADDYGHMNKVPGWHRSTDAISIKFISLSMDGSMMGWGYSYKFECTAFRNEEE